MTDVSDYGERVPYYRQRYRRLRARYLANSREYHRKNRAALTYARKAGVSIGEARRILRRH